MLTGGVKRNHSSKGWHEMARPVDTGSSEVLHGTNQDAGDRRGNGKSEISGQAIMVGWHVHHQTLSLIHTWECSGCSPEIKTATTQGADGLAKSSTFLCRVSKVTSTHIYTHTHPQACTVCIRPKAALQGKTSICKFLLISLFLEKAPD